MKKQATTQHLTDAAFSDLLAGQQPNADTFAHLESCEHCRTELDEVRGTVAGFNEVSRAWASAEAPRRIPVPSRWTAYLRPSLASGLAVTAVTGILAFHFGNPSRSAETRQTQPMMEASAVPSKAELADDNRLMLSIDQELSYRVQPSVPASALHEEAHTDVNRGSGTVLN